MTVAVLLLLLRLLFLVILKAAMISLPIVGYDEVAPLLALVASRVSKDLSFRAKHLLWAVTRPPSLLLDLRR